MEQIDKYQILNQGLLLITKNKKDLFIPLEYEDFIKTISNTSSYQKPVLSIFDFIQDFLKDMNFCFCLYGDKEKNFWLKIHDSNFSDDKIYRFSDLIVAFPPNKYLYFISDDLIKENKTLEEQLNDAIEKEDFKKAKEIQDLIDKKSN